MTHPMLSQVQISAGAIQAAIAVTRRLGVGRIDPLVLHESQHVSIRLFPLDVVARVVSAAGAEADKRLCRELAVTRHLVERAAPIVAPTRELPAGPHFQDGFGLTLWQFVHHVAANEDDPHHMASAAGALRRVHAALADFRDELPDFRTRIGKCRALLANDLTLPALSGADRKFLLMVYDRIMASLHALRLDLVPIHGDAVLGNVFITPDGARWNDFEDVCMGPPEWDTGWLPHVDPNAGEPVNRDLVSVLSDLRSLCVSVWCWAKYDVPERRDAAQYHLGYLKTRFA